MPKVREDKTREERIIMEIIVDAHGPEERSMGWYYYLTDNLNFPFKGRCIKPLPDVYDGWIQDTVALSGTGRLSAEVQGWTDALTPAQKNPVPSP